jgi:hypothetical protein
VTVRTRFGVAFAILLSTAATAWANPPDATDGPKSPNPALPQNDAERYVDAQLARDAIADLNALPADKRTLRAAFLVSLLTGPAARTAQHGVRIAHASVIDRIDLAYAVIATRIQLTDCLLTEVDLSNAELQRGASFLRSDFAHGAYFGNARVHYTLDVQGATFHGGADFGVLQADSFDANRTRFLSTSELVSFNSMKIANNAVLYGAEFDGPTIFLGANVGGILGLDGSTFAKDVQLQTMIVSGPFTFRSWDQRNGPAQRILQTHFQGVDLSGTTARSFDGSDARFDKKVKFGGVQSSGAFSLTNAVFNDDVFFAGARLRLFQVKGATFNHGLDLADMQYTQVECGKADDCFVDYVEHANYSPRAYAQLENFLRDSGHAGEADDVEYRRQSRERRSELKAGSPAWMWSSFLWLFVGYGKHPELAFFWGGLFVIANIVVFRRREYMDRRDDKGPERGFSPFWYSLDAFFPVVDLDARTVWIPKARWRRTYLRIQTLIGWVLIPIALAALGGIIK